MISTYPTREEAVVAAIVDVAHSGEDRVVIHHDSCRIVGNTDGTVDRSTCSCVPLTLVFGARA